MPINERANLVFQDSDIIPLFIQVIAAQRTFAMLCQDFTFFSSGKLHQHAPEHCAQRPASHGTAEFETCHNGVQHPLKVCLVYFSLYQELLADASSAISDGDILNTTVRRHQAR